MTAETIEFLKLIGTELVMVSPVLIAVYLVIQGLKCLLRSEMLNTYYHNKEAEKIRQYELENFILLYKAYKAIKGNSFIDKIYGEVMKWEVIT